MTTITNCHLSVLGPPFYPHTSSVSRAISKHPHKPIIDKVPKGVVVSNTALALFNTQAQSQVCRGGIRRAHGGYYPFDPESQAAIFARSAAVAAALDHKRQIDQRPWIMSRFLPGRSAAGFGQQTHFRSRHKMRPKCCTWACRYCRTQRCPSTG